MPEIEVLKPAVHATGLVDVALLGVSKSVSERLLIPIIGNGSFKSGAIKLIGGSIIAHSMSSKVGSIVGGGLVIDGIDDCVTQLIGTGAAGAIASQDNW